MAEGEAYEIAGHILYESDLYVLRLQTYGYTTKWFPFLLIQRNNLSRYRTIRKGREKKGKRICTWLYYGRFLKKKSSFQFSFIESLCDKDSNFLY